MKMNWGVGIVIGMIAFMSFIMFMVITMMTDKNYDHDLVTEDYYARDLAYQTEIDAEENAQRLSSTIKLEKTAEGWLIHFPEEMTRGGIEGSVQLYRPSNQKLDFQLPLHIENTTMLVPGNRLVEGYWKVTIDWKMDGTAYLFKKEMAY